MKTATVVAVKDANERSEGESSDVVGHNSNPRAEKSLHVAKENKVW